ncbi:MAG: MFS transporter [Beijerinckiaceae bacterium]
MQADFLSDRSLSLRYGLAYAAFFFAVGVFGPFFPLFLKGQGFDAGTIGFLLALSGPVRVFAGPLMGWVADAGLGLRIIVTLAHVIAGVLVIMMLGITTALPMALLMAGTFALHGPLSPMIDASLSQIMLRRVTLNYARIRLWGSFSFVAGNLLGGLTADKLTSDWIAILIALAMFGGAAIGMLLPQVHTHHAAQPAAVEARVPARWGIIVAVVVASSAIQASHSAIYGVSALAWSAQGLSNTMTGLLWMLGVVTEIVLFLRVGQSVSGMRRAFLFIALGGGLAVLRWFLMTLEPGLAVTMLCQLLHGLTFGATHLGMIAALAVLSPPGMRSRIQGSNAALQALLGSVAIYYSGVLYQASGAPAAYGLMVLIAGAGFGVVTLLLLLARAPDPETAA